MSVEFTLQAIRATTEKYLKNYVDHTLRHRFLLSYLQKAGRIVTGESGTALNWRIKVRRPQVSTTSGGRLSWSNTDVYEPMNVGYAQMHSTNKLDRNTLLINKGEEQIINLVDEMAKDCSAAIGDALCAGVYVDGSSDSNQLTGLQTFIRPDVGANTDRIAPPASGSEYAGKSMVLGALGGRWSALLPADERFTTLPATATDWPEGSGDPEYDFLAFKGFNYTGAWSSGTNNWTVNCEKLLRRGQVAISALGGSGAAPSVHVMSRGMYNDFQDSVQDRERLSLSDYATKLGFPDTMQYSGVLLNWDYDCPPAVAYSLNPAEMALRVVTDQLFYTDGPEWNMIEQAHLFMIGFMGNFTWSPKNIAVYGSYTV